MCEKCRAIDDKIDHYRKISTRINDQQTREGIEVLVAGYEAQKALHPEK